MVFATAIAEGLMLSVKSFVQLWEIDMEAGTSIGFENDSTSVCSGCLMGENKMKALGITAMIFAIIAIFIPLVGPYLTLVCALLAAFAAGPGLTFGVVAILVNILNVAFLSPSLWLTAGIAEADVEGSGGMVLLGMGIVFVGVQVAAAVVLAVIHIIWKKRNSEAT